MKKWFVSIAMVLVAFMMQGCISTGIMNSSKTGPGCTENRKGLFLDFFSLPSMPCEPSGPVPVHAAAAVPGGPPYVIINNIPGGAPPPAPNGKGVSYQQNGAMLQQTSYGGSQTRLVPSGPAVDMPVDELEDMGDHYIHRRTGRMYVKVRT